MKKTIFTLTIIVILFASGCNKEVIETTQGEAKVVGIANYLSNDDVLLVLPYIQKEESERTTEKDEEQPPLLTKILNRNNIKYEDLNFDQLVCVGNTDDGKRMYFYNKENNKWTLDKDFSGIGVCVGKNGTTNNKREGDKCTPVGLYSLGFAFGIKENPGTSVEYRRVNENCYWVDDPASDKYNQWVESTDKTWNSAEHLIDYNPSYNYAMVIEYNTNPIEKGKGSAIFLHVGNSSTAGCVAIDESHMIKILQRVKSGAKILVE